MKRRNSTIQPVKTILGGFISTLLLFAAGQSGALSNAVLEQGASAGVQTTTIAMLKTPWQGEAQGYDFRASTTPQQSLYSDEIANSESDYLIALTRVSSAVKAYKRFAAKARQSRTSVMSVYWNIEAVSSLGEQVRSDYASIKSQLADKNIPPLDAMLEQLAEPKTILAYTNGRTESRVAYKQVEALLDKVEYALSEDAFASFSLKSVMLARSGLLREAGQLLETAVSANGHVLDKRSYERAKALVESTKQVKVVDHLAFCEQEQHPGLQFSQRLEQFEQRLGVAAQDPSRVGINAGDAYALAGQALDIGLAAKPQDHCAGRFMISQMD